MQAVVGALWSPSDGKTVLVSQWNGSDDCQLFWVDLLSGNKTLSGKQLKAYRRRRRGRGK